MDHELAVQNQAVERYVLGEMQPDERDAFEEHYFECESCAGDVRATSDFVEAAKAIFREGRSWLQPARSWASWFSWKTAPSFAFAAAAALCVIVIGYQNLAVIPSLQAPQSAASLTFDGATRGAALTIREGQALRFEMPWDRGGPAYVELRRDSKVLSRGTVTAPAPNQPLEVYFPGKLNPGGYSVVVRAMKDGQPAQESIENQFEVIP